MSNKKMLGRIERPQNVGFFTSEEAKAKDMRLCKGLGGEKEQGAYIALYLLIDEEDGVIADAKFQLFGPSTLVAAADVLCDLLVRKNYMQARRISVELIENEFTDSIPEEHAPLLNHLIDAIDYATEHCLDIPIEDIYIAPPTMQDGERTEYPNWETLTNEQKKSVIVAVVEQDIQPYVELDAGGVEVLKIEDNRITIAYSGNCTSCFSATGATLDAIGNILRHKVFPDLMVIPDMSVLSG